MPHPLFLGQGDPDGLWERDAVGFRFEMKLLSGTNLIFMVFLVIYVAIRKHFMTKIAYEDVEASAVDPKDRVLVFLMALTVILLPVAFLFSPLFQYFDYSLPIEIRSLGILLLSGSLFMFWRSHADLGANWSPTLEVRKGHRLITQGIYQRIRHPMYSSIWLWAIGQGMMIPNWLIGWGPMVCFSVMYFTRLPREERLMLDRFGAEYEAYQRRTGRIFPKVW